MIFSTICKWVCRHNGGVQVMFAVQSDTQKDNVLVNVSAVNTNFRQGEPYLITITPGTNPPAAN